MLLSAKPHIVFKDEPLVSSQAFYIWQEKSSAVQPSFSTSVSTRRTLHTFVNSNQGWWGGFVKLSSGHTLSQWEPSENEGWLEGKLQLTCSRKKTGRHLWSSEEVQPGHQSAAQMSHMLFHSVTPVSVSASVFLRAHHLRGHFNVCIIDYIDAAVCFSLEQFRNKEAMNSDSDPKHQGWAMIKIYKATGS